MADGMLRVAHVLHGLMMGGLEQVVVRLCETGRAFGIEPHVIAFGTDGVVREVLRDKQIPTTHLPGRGMSLSTISGIARVLRDQQIDVVHAHDHGPWLNSVAARALAPGVKTAVTFHQITTPRGLQRGAAVGAALVTDALVACGDQVLSCVRDWAPASARIELIGNGVPIGVEPSSADRLRARVRMGVPPEAKVVGYLGRLHPEKGVDLLVDAFCRDLAGREEVHLVLIGKGPQEPQLRLRAEGDGRVHFLGEVVDATSLLAGMDVYVQPSRREGRSLAMLEAMAAALPTVAQGLPAMREIHLHQQTALLVPPSEQPELAAAILRLLDDPELRTRMGRHARAHSQQFSVSAMVQSYAALYRSLRGESPPLGAIGAFK